MPGWAAAEVERERCNLEWSAVMRTRQKVPLRLLPLGAGSRLLGAALIVAALWGAFLWATSTPGTS